MSKAVRTGLALAILALIAVPAAAERWDERFTNPAPAEGDVVLPMPCGAAMVFRPVATRTSGNWLDDVQLELGLSTEDGILAELPHRAHLTGSLVGDGPEDRYYLMAKYPVTADQYAAVMEPECPRPAMRGLVPAVDLGWFDAIAFTRAYSEWLLTHARDALPTADGAPSIVRLPTEVEWEFAARGGQAVSEAEFRARLFPMEEDIAAYAWFQGPRSAQGRLRPVGQLRPNPLGLHDILGNAEEMVLEPFRLSRGGRLHGQAGGFVARGGSILTAENRLRTALRVEYAYFDASSAAATRLSSLGFRVLLAAPTQPSLERVEQLRADWQDFSRPRHIDFDDDPLLALEAIAGAAEDTAVADALRGAADALRAEIAARNAVEGRAVRSAITAGAVLIRKFRDDDRRVNQLQDALVELGPEEELSEALRPYAVQLAAALEGARQVRRITGDAYLDLLLQTADDFGVQLVDDQLGLALQRYRETGIDSLEPFAQTFARQVALQIDAPPQAPRAFLDDLLDIAP